MTVETVVKLRREAFEKWRNNDLDKEIKWYQRNLWQRIKNWKKVELLKRIKESETLPNTVDAIWHLTETDVSVSLADIFFTFNALVCREVECPIYEEEE